MLPRRGKRGAFCTTHGVTFLARHERAAIEISILRDIVQHLFSINGNMFYPNTFCFVYDTAGAR